LIFEIKLEIYQISTVDNQSFNSISSAKKLKKTVNFKSLLES